MTKCVKKKKSMDKNEKKKLKKKKDFRFIFLHVIEFYIIILNI